MNYWRWTLLATVLSVLSPQTGLAVVYNVIIDTSPWVGEKAKTVWDFTTSDARDDGGIEYIDWAQYGVRSRAEFDGGPIRYRIGGSLTTIRDSTFCNQVIEGYDSLGVSVGYTIESLGSGGGRSDSGCAEHLAFYLLRDDYTPLLETSDPWGTNALFSITITGDCEKTPGSCVLEVFAPTIFQPPNSIILPSLTGLDGDLEGDTTPFGFVSVDPIQLAPSIRFQFGLPADGGVVRLKVFDVGGRLVADVLNDRRPGGKAVAEWNGVGRSGHGVASGVYFARLEWEQRVDARKFIVVR